MFPNAEDYFDHDADIGIIGRGDTLEKCFISAAKAMFNIMVNTAAVQSKNSVAIQFEESDVELALVTWLNLLLAKAVENSLVFGHFTLTRQGDQWIGTASGEAWRDNLERGIEVKGATLTMLSVKNHGGIFEARCVVDV